MTIPNTELKALPTAVLYGANGAGKSNLIKAMSFAISLIKNGVPPKSAIPVQAFGLGMTVGKNVSKFVFRFVKHTTTFEYGFEIDAEQVHSEWLDRYEGETPKILFERAIGPNGSHEIEVSDVLRKDSEKVAQLGKLGVLRNQLLLTSIPHNIEKSEQGTLIRSVLEWVEDFIFIFPETHFESGLALWLARHEHFRSFINSYLREAGTGVNSLQVVAKPVATLPMDVRDQLKAQLKADKTRLIDCKIDPNKEIYVDLDPSGEVVTFDIVAKHPTETGGEAELAFTEQSDGTKRLAELLVGLRLTGMADTMVIVDELDRSLHPLLAKKFIDYFLRKRNCSQLLFTTHETHLLDLNLLRRDEIWFAEKNSAGATHIYPLSDFPVRSDLRADKGYLQGRFGAIPFLGGIDELQ